MIIKVYHYHSRIKHTTCMGKYNSLKSALRAAKQSKAYYDRTNSSWMSIWIGE